MNSAICCNKLWRNVWGEIRRNMWVVAIAILSFMFVLPIRTVLAFQNWQVQYLLNDNMPRLIELVQDFCCFEGDALVMLVMVGASLVVPLVFFRYLMMKRQVNFYHSQPRTRRQLFAEHFLAGWLGVIVPYLVNMLLAALCLCALGLGEYIMWRPLLRLALVHGFFFTVLYAVTVLGAMLAGTTLMQLLLGGFMQVVISLGLLIYRVVRDLLQPAWYVLDGFWNDLLLRSAPLLKYLSLINADCSLDTPSLLYALLWLVVCVVLSLLLYQRRPLENTGSSLAFPKVRTLFKYPLVVYAAALCGCLLHEIGDLRGGMLWFYIGLVLGGLITAQMVEILFVSDFRGIRRKLLPALITVALLCGVSALVDLDVMGFGSYIPEADQVVGVDAELSSFSQYYYDGWKTQGDWSDEYTLSRLHSDEPAAIAAVLSLTEKLLAEGTENEEYYGQYIYEATAETASDYISPEPYDEQYFSPVEQVCSVTVRWYLADGRKQTREYDYVIETSAIQEEMALLYDTDDYRHNMYVLMDADPELCYLDTVSSFNCGSYYEPTGKLSDKQAAELVKVYQQELFEITAAQLADELPLGQMEIAVAERPLSDEEALSDGIYDCSCVFSVCNSYIYPSMNKTLAELEKLGCAVGFWQVDEQRVSSMTIDLYQGDEVCEDVIGLLQSRGLDAEKWITNENYGEMSVICTDKEQIMQALSMLKSEDALNVDPFSPPFLTLYVQLFIEHSESGYDSAYDKCVAYRFPVETR